MLHCSPSLFHLFKLIKCNSIGWYLSSFDFWNASPRSSCESCLHCVGRPGKQSSIRIKEKQKFIYVKYSKKPFFCHFGCDFESCFDDKTWSWIYLMGFSALLYIDQKSFIYRCDDDIRMPQWVSTMADTGHDCSHYCISLNYTLMKNMKVIVGKLTL